MRAIWRDIAGAARTLATRLERIPRDQDEVARLSQRFRNMGDSRRADDLWRRYVRKNPGLPGARRKLAQSLWQSGERDEALQELRTSIKAEPRHENAWRTLVKWYGQMAQPAKAMDAAREWCDSAPDCAAADLQMGRLLLAREQVEAALARLERAQRDAEAATEAAMEILLVNLRLGKRELGLQQLDRCLSSTLPSRPPNASTIDRLIQQLHLMDKPAIIVACCEKFSGGQAENPLRLAYWALSLQRLGRDEEAERVLARLLPGTAADPAQHGRALWLLGRREEALAAMRESLRRRPGFPNNWRALAKWLEQDGRLDESLETVRSWLAMAPDAPLANWSLAERLVSRHCLEEARPYIDKALADETAMRDAGIDVIRAYLEGEQLKPAIELMEKLLTEPARLSFSSAARITMLARGFLARTRYAMAERCCSAVAHYYDRDPPFLALHGHVLLALGEVERARRMLERSVYLAPAETRAPRMLLALSYFHRGDSGLARAYLSEAVDAREEGSVFDVLFGGAAPLVPHFGLEIDQALAGARA